MEQRAECFVGADASFVAPAKAGAQVAARVFVLNLDPGLRRDDCFVGLRRDDIVALDDSFALRRDDCFVGLRRDGCVAPAKARAQVAARAFVLNLDPGRRRDDSFALRRNDSFVGLRRNDSFVGLRRDHKGSTDA